MTQRSLMNKVNNYELVTIVGPTASGKTALAVALAHRLHSEIISADSRQVYRRMDIGTGKDLDEYRVGEETIPHHLIDIVEPGYKYNVYEFQRDFLEAYLQVRSKGLLPVLCGGTGLYVESVLKAYDFAHDDASFPPIRNLLVGVDISRELRRAKISARLRQRLDEGMVDEIRGLINSGVSINALLHYGLEYKYVTLHILGELSYQEMFNQLEIAIHQFAKRQMTCFHGMERRGFNIQWVDALLPMQKKTDYICSLLE